MRGAVIVLCLGALVAVSCLGPDPNVTPEGAGLPELEIGFPDSSASGSVQPAVLTITNPGPRPMSTVVVAFARVGPAAGGRELPDPIVDGGAQRRNPAIVSIDPEPRAVSLAAVEFTFDGLAEGESAEITFELRVPSEPGEAANSVTVYEGSDPSRVRGARLATTVQ
jgi:hypothetical protein